MFDCRGPSPAFEVRTVAGRDGIRVTWELTLPAGVTSREAYDLIELVHDNIGAALLLEGWLS